MLTFKYESKWIQNSEWSKCEEGLKKLQMAKIRYLWVHMIIGHKMYITVRIEFHTYVGGDKE